MDVLGGGFQNLPPIDMNKIEAGLKQLDAQIQEGLKHMEEFQAKMEQGVFEPGTIVPGIGLGATDMPQPPNREQMMELSNMQREHGVERQEALQDLEAGVEDKKALFFAENHYEFDENGKPKVDGNGNPVIVEGAETAEQGVYRRRWEREQQKAVKAEYREKMDQVREEYQKYMSSVNFMDIFGNPEKKQEYWDKANEMVAKLQAIEQDQFKAICKAGSGFLPDPENPGSTIGNFIDGKMSEYESLVAQQKTEESNSPAGLAMASYGERMKEYMEEQRERLEDMVGDMFDPNQLRNYARGQGIV